MEVGRCIDYVPVTASPRSDPIVDTESPSRFLNERLNRDHGVEEGIIEKVPGVYRLSIA